MTTFTTEELSHLANAVMVTGMAVSVVEAGVVSTAIEATALVKEIAGAAAKYPANEVIQSLFSEGALKQAKDSGGLKFDVKPDDLKPEAAVDTAIAHINRALAVLTEKGVSDAEIQTYKTFIYTCAERVASAAGSGLFGSGSPKVSDSEAIALTKLKAALGV